MSKRISSLVVFCILIGFFAQVSVHAEEAKKEFTLKDAIYHALKNNLDLKVQMTDVTLAQEGLNINKSIFIPQLTLTGSTRETNTPPRGVLSGVGEDDIETNKTANLNVILNQNLPHGGRVTVNMFNQRNSTNNIFNQIDPFLLSQGNITLVQPLLKNFGLTPTKRDIYIGIKDLKIAKHTLRQNIIDLVFNVEQAYWQLVFAHQNLEATSMALKRAQDLLKQNQIKVRVGSAAPIEVLTAKAEVARNEGNMIQAEMQIQTAEENLKKILNLSRTPIIVIPSDKPNVKPLETNFDQYFQEALAGRPDIFQAKLNVAKSLIELKVAKNGVLPDLQLTGQYWSNGQGGQLYTFLKNPLNDPTFTADDRVKAELISIWDSMEQVFKNKYKNYSIELQLQIPLGFRQEKAQLSRAKINLERTRIQLENTTNNLYSEIREVIKELEANAKLVEANRIALELEDQKLKAELKRLAVGISTNLVVMDFQREYAAAETRALQSVIDYNMTLAKINRILARTFRTYDIKLKDFVK